MSERGSKWALVEMKETRGKEREEKNERCPGGLLYSAMASSETVIFRRQKRHIVETMETRPLHRTNSDIDVLV